VVESTLRILARAECMCVSGSYEGGRFRERSVLTQLCIKTLLFLPRLQIEVRDKTVHGQTTAAVASHKSGDVTLQIVRGAVSVNITALNL
jgi:hypothetical protein